jgi:hypothetical protein
MKIDCISPSAILFAAVLAAGAGAQEWYPETQNTAPPARRFHAVANLAGQTVLFGGVDERNARVHGDTWTYDGMRWMQHAAAGPAARQRFAACVDGARGVLVVFGGADANGQPLGDTWQFDGSTWQQVVTPGPSPRLGAAMAFDTARGRAVLFGGGATAGLAGSTGFGAETWEWNGTDWRQVVTATVPAGSAFPAMTFFAAHGVAVLTGGSGAGGQALATWAFDGVDWMVGPQAPTGLASRQGHAISYDALREMVVLFGGARIAIGGAVPFDDTWELSTPATFATFGAGCGAGGAVPMLGAGSSRPQLGSSFRLEVAPAGSLVLVIAGLSDTSFLGQPLPIDLSGLGLPGCELLTSIDHVVPTTVTGALAAATFSIPLRRMLLGQQVFAQAVVVQPGGMLALSDGGRITIGN